MTTNSIDTTTTKRRVTIFLQPAITKHARAQAIIEDMTLTALVEKALINYLPKETVIRKVEVPPRDSTLN